MLEVAYDYLHLPFKHKSSFNDFRVIEENNNILVFYYETRLLNFLPMSPVVKFISIRKLIPDKQMYNQVYMDIKSKKIFYHTWRQHVENNEIIVHSDFSVPLTSIQYCFRKILLFIINKKLDRMWKEDLEMLIHRKNNLFTENKQCLPINFKLKNYLLKNLNNHFPVNFNPDYLLNENNDNKIHKN